MGIGYRLAIFLSARGVNKTVNTKLPSIDDLVTIENIPSTMASVRRAMLRYDSLEVRASIKGKIEIIIITETESITNFILNGELEFLKEMNEMAFLDICNKKNILDENILIFSPSKLKSLGENIGILSETIRDYEKIMQEFVDWFVSNNMVVPSLPQQNISLKSAHKNIITGNQNDLNVSISCFDTLVLIIPKHLEPRDRILIRLRGNSRKTDYIKISQIRASFLMYLALERNENDKLWLLNPENHIDVLIQIYNQFELPVYFEEEAHEKPKITQTWIYDFQNEYRRKYKSHINKRLMQRGNVKGTLINHVPGASYSRGAIYALTSTITNIEINTPIK